MSRRIVFRDSARIEIDEAAEWFERQNVGLGGEFFDAVSASIEAIRDNPLQYQRVFKDRRRAVVPRFRFNLIYLVTDDEIIIVACLHGRRDPQRWTRRS
jgi:plasmid stabilization system protein ParE